MVFTELPGQGILGGDYPCPHLGSVRPGMCAFNSVDQALVMCFVITMCQAVVVYREGADGLSAWVCVCVCNGQQLVRKCEVLVLAVWQQAVVARSLPGLVACSAAHV